MIRFSIVLVVCLAALLQQQGAESPTPPQTQSPAESSQSLKTVVDEEKIQGEVAEIMAIRSQIGGGVAATLGDLSLEMPGKAKQTEGSPPQEKPLDLEGEFARQLAAQSRNHAAAVNDNLNRWATPQVVQTVHPSERQEAVRQAARMLEEAAAMLEEANEYDHADHVRKTASDLWKAARKH